MNQELIAIFESLMNLLPHKIKKRINKTGEARSGSGIIKRRNRRSYRVVIQYSTWLKFKTEATLNQLGNYEEGYVVLIKPVEYFGNYPEINPNLHQDFILGETGVVYYSTAQELESYPPFFEWQELIELSSIPNQNINPAWSGDVVFDVKNRQPYKISYICKKRSSQNQLELNNLKSIVIANYPGYDLDSLPQQAGIGNYDYDYANFSMIKKVKIQMLALLLLTKSRDNIRFSSFGNYIINHIEDTIIPREDSSIISKINNNTYANTIDLIVINFMNKAITENIVNFDLLTKIGSLQKQKVVCPLCRREVFLDEFFDEIDQDEGREVQDNTQRNIVLMHIQALAPGLLNHSIFNLGWGHSFCNTIQGGKDIIETIEELTEIIKNYNRFIINE
jgi:hypothetical protein